MSPKRLTKEITTKEIEEVLFKSADTVISMLPKLVTINVVAGFLGKQVKEHWDYYGRLLFHFAKDHPVQASALAGAMSYMASAEDEEHLKTLLAGASVVVVANSILGYRGEFQKKEIKGRMGGVWRKFDSMILPAGGTVFTSDAKMFFEVKYKFGDKIPMLKRFVITDKGVKKFERAETTFDRKSLTEFINGNKLVDVTACLRPDIDSFAF